MSFTQSSFQWFQRVRVAGHLVKTVHHFEAHSCEAVKVPVSVNLRFDSQRYLASNEDGKIVHDPIPLPGLADTWPIEYRVRSTPAEAWNIRLHWARQ